MFVKRPGRKLAISLKNGSGELSVFGHTTEKERSRKVPSLQSLRATEYSFKQMNDAICPVKQERLILSGMPLRERLRKRRRGETRGGSGVTPASGIVKLGLDIGNGLKGFSSARKARTLTSGRTSDSDKSDPELICLDQLMAESVRAARTWQVVRECCRREREVQEDRHGDEALSSVRSHERTVL
jgi:hypothetical protein